MAVLLLIVLAWFGVHAINGKVFLRTDCLFERYYPWKKWVNGEQTFGPCDSVEQVYPKRMFTTDRVVNGTVPLWNPYIFSGTPHAANPTYSVFSPFTLFYVLLPDPWAHDLASIGAFVVACIFMMLFLRALGCSAFASACGAVLFGLSGTNVRWPSEGSELNTAVWLPFLLFALTRYASHGRFRYLALASMAVAMSVFGGMWEYVVFMVLFAGAYFVFVAPSADSGRGWCGGAIWRGVVFLLVVGLGMLLSAIQLVPGLELYREGTRPELPLSMVGFVAPYSVVELVLPVEPMYGVLSGLRFENENLFIGLLPLTIILYVLCASARGEDRNRLVVFLLMAGAVVLLMAFGIPGFKHLYHWVLPVSRRVHRILLLFHFCVAALVALGITRLERQEPTAARASLLRTILISVGVAAIAGVLLLFLGSLLLADDDVRHRAAAYLWEVYRHAAGPTGSEGKIQKVALILEEFAKRHEVFTLYSVGHLLPLYAGLVGIGVFWYCVTLKGGVKAQVLRLALIGILVIPPLHFMNREKAFGERDKLYPMSESIRFLQAAGPAYGFRVMGLDRAFSNVLPLVFGIHSVGGIDAIFPNRVLALWSLVEPTLAESCRKGYCGEVSFSAETANLGSPIVNMFNVRYVVARESADLDRYGFRLVFRSAVDGVAIWENPRALPRAFFVPRCIKTNGKELVLLQDPGFDPSRYVMISGPVSGSAACGERAVSADRGAGSSVTIVAYEPEAVRVNVTAGTDGFLVLGDTYYPGWRARVDGVDSKVYVANYALRAVSIPTGSHEVLFYYDPDTFKVGGLLTLTYPLALGICYVVHRRWSDTMAVGA